MNAPCLTELVNYLLPRSEEVSTKFRCSGDWKEFLTALASASPVCALIHPGNELQHILNTIADGCNNFDVYTLSFLQQNCPLILNLLQRLKHPPQQIAPVIHELLRKANAPFIGCPTDLEAETKYCGSDDDNSYFPALPIVRSRGSYLADTIKRAKICTKRGLSHPTLLPGIFTVFCSHGKIPYVLSLAISTCMYIVHDLH